ncbi:Disease resistance protein [Morus notabilis]|uniref:Disease resistance protein n=1 Tax=Morus notabilis TaxID=981085 RepID=W9S2M5_9ROSA|nr:Disease resistance protein [Morus notabilis]
MRYKQSKKARKVAEVVISEIQDVGKFGKVSHRRPLQISIKNKGYETFETRMPTFLGKLCLLKKLLDMPKVKIYSVNELDLDAIGISFADDLKGCKVLLTSRLEDVLRNDMAVDVRSNLEVGVLSDGEATDLFEKIVGDMVRGIDFQSLRIQIVKECAGLPLAVSTVASALKNKTSAVWKDALPKSV